MIQKKMADYKPNYPRKFIRGAALTIVAAASIGAVGCEPALQGATTIAEPQSIVEPTEEPALMGDVAIVEPPDEELILDGEIMVDDTGTDEADDDNCDLSLSGAVAIPDDTNN